MPETSSWHPHVLDSRYGQGQDAPIPSWRILPLPQGRYALALVAGGRRTEIVLREDEFDALRTCLQEHAPQGVRAAVCARVRRAFSWGR